MKDNDVIRMAVCPLCGRAYPRRSGAFQREQRNAYLPGLRYKTGTPVHRSEAV